MNAQWSLHYIRQKKENRNILPLCQKQSKSKFQCYGTDPLSEDSVSKMMLLVLLSIIMLEMSPP